MSRIRTIQKPFYSVLHRTCLLVAYTLVAAFLFMQSCVTLRHKDENSAYVNNDSTATYSTHPSRPFRYGFAYTKEECEKNFKNAVKDYQIEKGDNIADIGAASGWIEGIFSVLVDSVNFYIQDIDTVFLNQTQFNNVTKHYTKVRGRPQTNTFHYVIGTEKKTNLPDSMFDKVIFNNTYHEILKPWAITADASMKIKPDGKIMIREAFSNPYKTMYHNGCNIKCDKAKTIIQMLEIDELYLTGMTEPENSFHNHLVFEKNKERSLDFYAKKNKLDVFIRELDKFNVLIFSENSVFTNATGIYLQEHSEDIHRVYTTLETYINTIGYNWIAENKLASAINVLKVNVMLYPGSANAYDSLAEAYIKNSQDSLALENYTKSVSLNNDNLNGKEQVKKLKAKLNIQE